MSFPGVGVNVQNGNLLRSVAVSDGVGALLVSVKTPELIGKVQSVFSLADAVKKGYDEAKEAFVYRLLKEFYAELGGNMQLRVMGFSELDTMAVVLDSTNELGVKRLLSFDRNINLVAIARNIPTGQLEASFLGKDVEDAVLISKAIGRSKQEENNPIRFLIEGKVHNATADNNFIPREAENPFAGVVLGGTVTDGSAAVTIALARALAFPAHVKIGSGQNGPLTISQIYIGNEEIEQRMDMAHLHDQGFITFHSRPGSAGYYFGVDNMADSSDFRILVHGRIVDKAQRIAAAAYTPFVEDNVRINSDGTINATDAKHLEDVLSLAVRTGMQGQISGLEVKIDPNQDLVNTSSLEVALKILPLGYLTWITVNLGLTNKLE